MKKTNVMFCAALLAALAQAASMTTTWGEKVTLAKARCHLTDSVRTYTEVPLDLRSADAGIIRMQPNSFAVVEW